VVGTISSLKQSRDAGPQCENSIARLWTVVFKEACLTQCCSRTASAAVAAEVAVRFSQPTKQQAYVVMQCMNSEAIICVEGCWFPKNALSSAHLAWPLAAQGQPNISSSLLSHRHAPVPRCLLLCCAAACAAAARRPTPSACPTWPRCRRRGSASPCACGWTGPASACAWTCLEAWTAHSPFRFVVEGRAGQQSGLLLVRPLLHVDSCAWNTCCRCLALQQTETCRCRTVLTQQAAAHGAGSSSCSGLRCMHSTRTIT
jgi:hypothetical protein